MLSMLYATLRSNDPHRQVDTYVTAGLEVLKSLSYTLTIGLYDGQYHLQRSQRPLLSSERKHGYKDQWCLHLAAALGVSTK